MVRRVAGTEVLCDTTADARIGAPTHSLVTMGATDRERVALHKAWWLGISFPRTQQILATKSLGRAQPCPQVG